MEFLGETVLSSGQRINLRDEVIRILKSGNLLVVPIEIDESCRGEFFLDTSGTQLRDPKSRKALDAILEATTNVYQRAHLGRQLEKEADLLAAAGRREAETHRHLLHVERLASIGRLAAGAAHEINNPLAVISGKAQLLAARISDEKASAVLNDIVDQSMRISKIISDLMGFARPAEPTLAEATVLTMVENAMHMTRHRLPKNKSDIVIEIPKDIPRLQVDSRQVEQVLTNLFVNAMQAMGDHGKLIISAENIVRTHRVLIRVMDNGPGIRPEDLPKIFDPFFTTKREGEGTGLGLAVSQRIVETHSGSLSVQSRVGTGTTFLLQLPVVEKEKQAVASIKPKNSTQRSRPNRKRILVVDDEKQLSGLIRDFLSDAGYLVDVANDGEEGSRILEAEMYDALILDIRMPRKDGLEVLRDLREISPSIPTLVITGLATNEEVDQANLYGAEKVLRKPFQLDELLHAVDQMLLKKTTGRVS
jgi:signal transduction histidine kinase/CheY-like chemotaxis protein